MYTQTHNMKMLLTYVLVFGFALATVKGSLVDTDNGQSGGDKNLLLLVIYDGFRYDYLEKTDMPHFNLLVAKGVKPASVVPSFTSKTFPAHYTIATGLYQESHGIVGNRMYDPVFNSRFDNRTVEPRWWDAAEPIWVTNQKNDGKTVSVFYPGDNVSLSGGPATFRQLVYNESMNFTDRVDFVVDHMANKGANLGLLYFHEPDRIGHLHGPDSPQLEKVLKDCDDNLQYLIDKLKNASLTDRVNIILTGDHGMTNVSKDQTVFLNEYINLDLFNYTNNNAVFGVWPHNDANKMTLYLALSCAHPNLKVYLKEEIPDELHYRDNRRISPILVIMDEGWQVWTDQSINGKWQTNKGNHGYRSTVRNMEAIFIAAGPSFKTDYQPSKSFDSVEIYNLMCHLLNITAAPNNGTFSKVEWLLAGNAGDTLSGFRPFISALFVAVIILVF